MYNSIQPKDEYALPNLHIVENQITDKSMSNVIYAADRFRQPPETYHSIVDMGEEIFSFRETAIAEAVIERKNEIERQSWFDRLTGKEKPALVTNEDLKNNEAEEAGLLFAQDGSQHLFVLDDRNPLIEKAYGGEKVLDFVYANLDPKTKQPNYALIYRVTPTSVQKIYNGHSYSLSVDELKNFLSVVREYRSVILEKLYPIDADIEGLKAEISQDLQYTPPAEERRAA
ncbi:MAG: hypothetical protein WAR37_01170 [Candidatus Microsaccharimonas sp.]